MRDRDYVHFNTSMGIKIESKKHYEHEMAKRGLISKEKADDIARSVNAKAHKTPVLSKQANEVIKSITGGRSSWNKGEKVTLSDRQVEGMKKCGLSFENTMNLNKKSGGFK